MAKSRGLGKGLGALFGDTEDIYNTLSEDIDFGEPIESAEPVIQKPKKQPEKEVIIKEVEVIKEVVKNGTLDLNINLIEPNPNQPRKYFDEEALRELADSIIQHGVIQPIVVNKQGEKFIIIAGERRWRASRMAGLETIPAIIKNYSEQQVKEISLIENLQREDLNPIEAARAIKSLMDEFNFTQEEVAKRIGKARPTIANTLRLLTLNNYIVKLIEDGRLSAGHARCLVAIEDSDVQTQFAMKACDNKMSVRDLENAVKKLTEPKAEAEKKFIPQSLELVNLVENMQRVFATRVTAVGNNRKGRISIDYFTTDDLDRILELIEELKNRKKVD